MAITITAGGKTVYVDDNTSLEEQQKIKDRLEGKVEAPEPSETKETEEKRGWIKDTAVQVVGGIRDGAQSTLGLLEKVSEDLSEKTNIGGFVIGKDAKDGFIDYVSAEEAKERGTKFFGSGEIGKKDAYQLPEVEEADTAIGGLSRGVSQFLTGWFTGGKLLKGAKAVTTGGKFGVSMGKGAIADFQVFDEETGRFVDMVNTHAPTLQNPLFDYLSAEGKDESFYEARFKNAIEGLMLGGLTEGVIRGAKPAKEKIFNTAKYIRHTYLRRFGKETDISKLKEIEESLIKNAEDSTLINDGVPFTGKGGEKAFKKSLADEAGSVKITQTVKQFKEITSAEEINKKAVDAFDNYINRIRAGEKTIKAKKKGKLDWKNIDDDLDFNMSPRAMADTNFGILLMNAVQKSIKDSRKFVSISDAMIEKSALKAGGDVVKATKMVGNLGDQMESGLKYMWFAQAGLQNLSDGLYKMANSLRKGEKTYSEAQMKTMTALTMRLMRYDDKVASNLGRGLRLRSVLKDSNTDLSTESILNQVRNFEKWDGNFSEFINTVALIKDRNAMQKVFDYLFRNQIWNKVNEFWMSAVLSNPKTQIINAFSTGLNQYIKPINAFVGSKMTWGLDVKTARLVQEEGQVALDTLAGLKSYFGDSLTFAKKAFNDEDSILFAGSTKYDNMTKSLGTGKWAKRVRIPLRGLTAGDEFFKQINYRSKLMAISMKEARLLKKSTTKIVDTLPNGKKISEFEAYVANRFKAGFDEAGLEGLDKEAKRYTQEVTFTKDLDGTLAKIQEAVNEAPILKQVLPFIKTPANLAIQAVEYTPFGVTGKNWKHFTGASSDMVKIAETRGRLAVGTTILFSAGMLANAGILQGGGHPDKNLRKIQRQNGHVPYSVKIGNVQIEFGRLDPIGMLLGLVADYGEIYQDLNETDRLKVENDLLQFMINQQEGTGQDTLGDAHKVTNMVVAGYKSAFKNIASKTYLRSLIDVVSALNGEDVDKKGAWWFKNKATSFYPNIFSKIGQDPILRDTQTWMDMMKRKIGSRKIAPQYNFMGEPIQDPQGLGMRIFNSMFNPITIKGEKGDAVLKMIIDNEISIPPMPKVKMGVDLTQFKNPKTGKTAYEELNEKIGGSGLRKEIEQLMKRQDFIDAPSTIQIDENNKFGGKQVMVYELVKMYRDMIFEEIQYDDKYKSIQDEKMSIADAYISKDEIVDIGKATNEVPKTKKGIYKFLENTR